MGSANKVTASGWERNQADSCPGRWPMATQSSGIAGDSLPLNATHGVCSIRQTIRIWLGAGAGEQKGNAHLPKCGGWTVGHQGTGYTPKEAAHFDPRKSGGFWPRRKCFGS